MFDQALWTTLQGKLLYTSVWEDLGTTPFAYHFQPMLFLILPVYAIYPSSEILLILQSFFLALGALPIYWIAKKRLDETAGIVFSAMYLIYPALHGINQFDFHVEALSVPFFLFLFYFTLKREYPKVAFFALLILMCKEDSALTVVMFASYLLWKERLKIRRARQIEFLFPLLLILLGAAWLILSLQVIVPFFSKGDAYLHLTKFYPNLLDFKNPVAGLLHEINMKFLYTMLLFAPLLFLPILSPSTLLIALPALSLIVFAEHSPAYQIGYQYPYAMIGFIFISAIYGVEGLALNKNLLKKFSILLLISGLTFTLFISPTPLGFSTEGIPGVVLDGNLPAKTLHNKALTEVISLIPINASLSTQDNIYPHVSNRFEVHVGYRESDEYVLLDTTSKWFERHLYTFNITGQIARDYGLVVSVDGIHLFKRDYEGEPVTISVANGLKAKVYNGTRIYGVPIFESIEFSVNHTWGLEAPFFTIVNDTFSVVFQGYLYTPETGKYSFRIHSDDGSRLYIDDKLVLDGWGPEPFLGNITLNLEQDFHRVKVEYVDYEGFASIWLYWKTPYKKEFELVSQNNLHLQPNFQKE